MSNNVTVLIPIGPNPIYQTWLPEAIESVLRQTILPDEILVVADGFDLNISHYLYDHTFIADRYNTYNKTSFYKEKDSPVISYWRSPWNIGFSQAFNCGVGLSDNDLIIYLAADDTLSPECVADCLETWEVYNHKDAWYALTYESPSGGVCSIPINAAMITRNLWKAMRGFPPAAFAGPDAALLSCLMVHGPDKSSK